MQVCVPSTPAQVYHMLRRQALRGMRRPLIVMSPKSLLRHPLAVSSLEELAEGRFEAVIGEADDLNPADVKRVVLCSGKVYYDLLEQRRKNNQTDVAIIRIEQLYPFPHEDIHAILAPFSHVKDFVWCRKSRSTRARGTAASIISVMRFRQVRRCVMRAVRHPPLRPWVIRLFTSSNNKSWLMMH